MSDRAQYWGKAVESERKKRRIVRLSALAICAGTFGCTMPPDVPDPQLQLPGAYIKRSATDWRPPSSPYDFSGFKSKRLSDLIARGRGFNLTIGAAIAQIQQAEAQVRIATQPLIPLIQANGSASQSLTHVNGQAIRTTQVVAQLTASYVLDFWGQNRSLLAAAEANEYVSSFNAATVAITVDSNVANNYFQAVATQKQIDIAKENLRTAQRILNAIRERNKAGTASGLDVAQQETLVANVQATIPPLERNLEQFKHAVAVLVGTAPEFFTLPIEDLYSIAIPKIQPGLPSDLLCRRPDIASAEGQLAAARFNVSAARAAMFPTIQLTGSGGFESVALASLFRPQSLFYNMAVNITQPLTNLYQLQAQLDQDKAIYGQLLENYRNTIITAFQNVEDALIAIRKNAEQEKPQALAVDWARKALQIAESQLKGGIIDITTLLQIQQTLFTAENALAQVRLTRLQAAVSLYQALGGGWYKPFASGIAEVPSYIEVKAKAP